MRKHTTVASHHTWRQTFTAWLVVMNKLWGSDNAEGLDLWSSCKKARVRRTVIWYSAMAFPLRHTHTEWPSAEWLMLLSLYLEWKVCLKTGEDVDIKPLANILFQQSVFCASYLVHVKLNGVIDMVTFHWSQKLANNTNKWLTLVLICSPHHSRKCSTWPPVAYYCHLMLIFRVFWKVHFSGSSSGEHEQSAHSYWTRFV